MLALIIVLACIGGGLTFSVVAVVGALFMTGRVSLPNSPQRRIQQAKNDAEVSRFQLQAAENRLETDRLIAQRDLGNFQAQLEIERLRDKEFQRALETANED